jgi:arginase family enzyme
MLVDGAHPRFWVDPATLSIADIGDFRIALGDIPSSLALIQEQAAGLSHLVALGGEHGITLPLLRTQAERQGGPLGLVHFDAHVDTWPNNFGQVYAHGSVFYHAINERLIDPARTVQIGIRSPVQREVWDWTVGRGVTILPAQEVHAMALPPLRIASAPWRNTAPLILASISMSSTLRSPQEPGPRKSAGWRAGRRRQFFACSRG